MAIGIVRWRHVVVDLLRENLARRLKAARVHPQVRALELADYDHQKRVQRVVDLSCCCCGNGTRGRQWWNRDTGYGICSSCITWMRGRGTSEAEIASSYGREGYHFNVEVSV